MDEKEQHQVLINEIRYAQRITQRTARLYRRVGTFLTFISILGGSGMVASMSSKLPDELVVAGGILLAVAGAAAIAIRPLEKAIVNEQDLKKYTALETQAVAMDLPALKAALGKARETDAAEVELLRDVAYNDVVVESGRPDLRADLTMPQKLIAAIA